jgi:predicted nucleotidyltransferase
VPDARYLIGLSEFEQWESDGSDHVIFGLSKFCKLALQGNPNIIELLFSPPECQVFVHPELGQPLLDARYEMLSKQVGERFMNYALHQLKRIERHHRWLVDPPEREPDPLDFGATFSDGRVQFNSVAREKEFKAAQRKWVDYQTWRKERHPKRAELEAAHGYDTKHASHLCRLLNMGEEILKEGEVHVRRADADFLRGVRNGELNYDALLSWAQTRIQRLPDLVESSPLPEFPDARKIEELVIEIHRKALNIYF